MLKLHSTNASARLNVKYVLHKYVLCRRTAIYSYVLHSCQLLSIYSAGPYLLRCVVWPFKVVRKAKACRNAVGSLTIPTIPTPCSLLDHKTCMHVGFKNLHILRFLGSQSKMENFNNSNWVLMEKGVLNVYCFYFQLEYFSTQVFYLKIFGFFYQVVHNLIFSFAVNDFLKFGSQICIGFRRIEMPPLAIISFVSYVQISSPQNVVTVFINATSMPTCFTIIKDPGKWKIQIFEILDEIILLLFSPAHQKL